MSKPNLVIVGYGMVSHALLQCLVAGGAHQQYNIIVFCEEDRCAYNRTALSEWFRGKTEEELSLVKPGFLEQFGIRVLLGHSIMKLDIEKKTVTSYKGLVLEWSKCVLATGSYPFIPPIPGVDGVGAFAYRTIDHLMAIKDYAKDCKRGAVVGGGLLGLEAAQSLLNLGLETHLVEFAPRLMALHLDETAASTLLRHIKAMGVNVHLSKNTTQVILGDQQQVTKLRFVTGEELETDLVVFSAGIRPRDDLARTAGLTVGPRGGVVINDYCQTSHPDVYAIGEVALHRGRIYGLVSPGNQMARVCGSHILGRETDRFEGAQMFTKLKVIGINVAVLGDSQGRTPGCESFTYTQSVKGIYKRLVTNSAMNKVLGAALIGDTTEYVQMLGMMLNEIPVPSDPATLILPENLQSAPEGVDLLPATAKICSCQNVSKGQLTCAMKEGCLNLEALQERTKAGTGCGGCIPTLKDLLRLEQERRGVSVAAYMCEHFQLTRMELCHLVMVHKYQTFDEVLTAHGKGRGCEVCKPAVASILAHTWGDHIHRPDLAVLQDTNDWLLANMQRDGTYSIVPRIPGGEVHPEALQKLGLIAQKYRLYSKITGAQRIDLFGARAHQLPAIWADLAEAGFESGHAYAKALRTVKSCVGTNWCRYGVQDSVGMAIALEARYKGLRSPHKIKMAVSGCVRECAEAQNKDVGLIAVSKGYNLYVCGNGGANPKHAILFATDLEADHAVRIIDRFLMFYCHTADRLQRTSKWLDAMEGGIDYLKKVLLDDSLGICNMLEAQMQMLAETYHNEWEVAFRDPVKQARFVTFVNLPPDEQDDLSEDTGIYLPPPIESPNPYPLAEPRPKPGLRIDGGGTEWNDVCSLELVLPDSGVCAKVDGVQIAVFRTKDDQLFALHNFDPFSEAFVLSRGILGDKEGVLKVASPLYKHNFALETGICLSKPHVRIPTYPVRLHNNTIQVMSTPLPAT